MSGVRKPIEDLDDIFIKISEKFSNKIEILKKKKSQQEILQQVKNKVKSITNR
jgi:hypothetical protein